MLSMKSLMKSTLDALWVFMKRNTLDAEPYFIACGVLLTLGLSADYFLWHNVTIQHYENIPLRTIAIILSLGLAFKNYWPSKLKAFMPIYWHITLIYTLTFFFTFMLLKNGAHSLWPMISIIALVFLILLTNWITTTFILFIGVSIGWIAYIATTTYPQAPDNLEGMMFTYIPILLAGGLFVRQKEKIHAEKLNSITEVSMIIAHELNTPLATLTIGTSYLKKNLPYLLAAYQTAQKTPLPVQTLNEARLQKFENLPDAMEREIIGASTFIRMLLSNSDPSIAQNMDDIFSINDCIDEALSRYILSEENKNLIHWKKENDFYVKGKQLLVTHLFFNLIKNSLHYISVSGKAPDVGYMEIWLDHGKSHNKVYVKDTGTGIAKSNLPHLFDQFFSKTAHGSRIGLTYCKRVMKSLGGDIVCESKENVYTLFILVFPKYRPDN
jgi:signal transduction histidine kinase